MVIKTKPLDERPRERCLKFGASTLSVRECLAILLGSGPRGKGCMGVAQDILNRFGGHSDLMSPVDIEDNFFLATKCGSTAWLDNISGLGDSGKAKVMVIGELMRRFHLHAGAPGTNDAGLHISKLETAAAKKIGATLRRASYEWFGFIPYFRRRGLGQLNVIEHGTRTHVNIDLQELFARLLMLRPEGIFLAHNHPSGELTASEADKHLTATVASLADAFHISVLGHVIVSEAGVVAF